MNKTILLVALIAILLPFTSAQFSINFTSVVIGWGNQSITAVPANITEEDGTQYWDIERNPIDAPEGEWTLDLINADGTMTAFTNENNDLVVVANDNSSASVASQIPPLLGITGPELVGIVSSNAQLAVETAYADPSIENITNAEANAYGNNAVNQVLASAGLPAFFLAPFKSQAESQIGQSLANAQAVSAAINANQATTTAGGAIDTAATTTTDAATTAVDTATTAANDAANAATNAAATAADNTVPPVV